MPFFGLIIVYSSKSQNIFESNLPYFGGIITFKYFCPDILFILLKFGANIVKLAVK